MNPEDGSSRATFGSSQSSGSILGCGLWSGFQTLPFPIPAIHSLLLACCILQAKTEPNTAAAQRTFAKPLRRCSLPNAHSSSAACARSSERDFDSELCSATFAAQLARSAVRMQVKVRAKVHVFITSLSVLLTTRISKRSGARSQKRTGQV